MPHASDLQGWVIVRLDRCGLRAHLGSVGAFDEALRLAGRSACTLRVGAAARTQMDQGGCGPSSWPGDLQYGPS